MPLRSRGTSVQGASQVNLELSPSRLDLHVQVLRGVRLHATRFLKGLEADADLRRSQLGLAHSYSRAKVLLMPSCCMVSYVSMHAVLAQGMPCTEMQEAIRPLCVLP